MHELAVRLAALAALLFYFCAVPVKFAFVLRIAEGTRFGAGAAAFENRFALRRAYARARGNRKHLPWKKVERRIVRWDTLPAALKAGRYLLRHLRLETLCARGRLSAGDAARTALLCGCAGALEGALAPCAPRGSVRFALQPDFTGAGCDLTLCGMVSLRIGHIILAALIGAGNFSLRRIRHGKASH